MILVKAPIHPVRCELNLPGSKSISNRVILLDAAYELGLQFKHLSDAEDTRLMRKALELIRSGKSNSIDIGHAGTDMRFLTAFLAATPGNYVLTGSERMQQRPIGELVDALTQMGAVIMYTGNTGYPPLQIKGRKLKGGDVTIRADISSQFISALLLIAPLCEQGLRLRRNGKAVSTPYIAMTIELMKQMGVLVEEDEYSIQVKPCRPSKSTSVFEIESDWSSASYWFSCCALSPSSTIQLNGLRKNSLQADAKLPDIYKTFGVDTVFNSNGIELHSNGNGSPGYFEYDFTDCPDIAQTLAVTCVALGVEAKLRGLSTLRLKETDRITALIKELEKTGTALNYEDDCLTIGHREVQHSMPELQIETYQDHRMAMSFAPLSLRYPSVHILDPEVVSKSYPEFWEDLKSAGFSVNLRA